MANQVAYGSYKSALQKMYFSSKRRGRKIFRLLPYKTHSFVIWLRKDNKECHNFLLPLVEPSARPTSTATLMSRELNGRNVCCRLATERTGSIRHHYARSYPVGAWVKAVVWSVTPFLRGGGALECAWSYTATPPLHRRGVLLGENDGY